MVNPSMFGLIEVIETESIMFLKLKKTIGSLKLVAIEDFRISSMKVLKTSSPSNSSLSFSSMRSHCK